MNTLTRALGLCLGLIMSSGLVFGQGLEGALQGKSGEGVVAVKEAFSASLSKPFMVQISLPTGTVLETLRLHGLREGLVRRISSDEELPLLMQGDEVRLVAGSKEGLAAFEGMVMNQEGWSFQKGGMLCIAPSFEGSVVCIPEDAVVEASLLSPKEGPPVAERLAEDKPLTIEVQGFPVTASPYLTYFVRTAGSETASAQSDPAQGWQIVNLRDGISKSDQELVDAVTSGNAGKVKELIDKGADVDAKDIYGRTVLMVAVINNRTDVARLLIDKGANVNAKDNDRNTALMHAAWGGRTDVARLLIDKGANVNAKNKGGATALMNAARNGNTEIVKLLVGKGANVNAKNKNGDTALMLAALNGHTDIVKILRDAGAKG